LLRQLLRDPQPALDELATTVGPVCGLGAGPLRIAVVGDPSVLRELFAITPDHFRWGHRFNVLGFVVGNGSMIVSDGPDHKRRRASVQAAFSRKRLNAWIPLIVAETDAAVDRALAAASTTDVVDLAPIARHLTLAVVVRSLFGDSMSARAEEIGRLFERPQAYLESPATRQLPHPFPRTARSRVRDDRRQLDALLAGEIATRRAHPDEFAWDVLSSLVANETLDDAEIRDQIVTLIGAGYDTTAASLSWMLWCATLAPGVWQRLRNEADASLPAVGASDTAAVPDESTLARLVVARAVMRETLRLHPAGAISPRQAVTDLVVGGYAIPHGTMVLWSAHLAGRDPEAWPDPQRFDPDRFADEAALSPEQRSASDAAWVPFGHGPRMCIGFALAQMELTLAIARVAQRLDLTAVGSTVPRPVGMVVNRPLGGVPMRVAERARPPVVAEEP
jgi:cytochrome P450